MKRVVGRVIVSVIVASSFFSSFVRAQWSLNHPFGVQIHSVYFLDQQGASSTGFVGLANTSIWRTTDNGGSWFQMTTPPTATSLRITGFAFKNTMQGWCSMRENGGAPSGGIWATTDGGLNWT